MAGFNFSPIQVQPQQQTSLADLMNVARGAQAYTQAEQINPLLQQKAKLDIQSGQQALQKGALELQSANRLNEETKNKQDFFSDPSNYLTEDGKLDLPKLNKTLPLIAPLTAADEITKLSALSTSQSQAETAKRALTKDKKSVFSTAISVLGHAGIEDPEIYKKQLDRIVEQFKDMTERKRYELALQEANRELEMLAAVDGLTQLSNRRIFDEKFKEEWRRMKRAKQPFSLILCDIDFFKFYNDHYGHQMGDDCLKAVAACIQNSIRRPGDLAARYGGEEFGVLLPNTSFEGAYHLAENIRSAVYEMKREHARSGVSDSVTLSLGVATLIPSEGKNSIEQLLKLADEALYSSKRAGRNRVTGAVQ